MNTAVATMILSAFTSDSSINQNNISVNNNNNNNNVLLPGRGNAGINITNLSSSLHLSHLNALGPTPYAPGILMNSTALATAQTNTINQLLPNIHSNNTNNNSNVNSNYLSSINYNGVGANAGNNYDGESQ